MLRYEVLNKMVSITILSGFLGWDNLFNNGGGMTDLYDMKLHEQTTPKNIPLTEITRVPGGWIYVYYQKDGMNGYRESTVFIPYNEEFIKTKEPEF